MSAHGTRSCYSQGCRCDVCRKANSEYERARKMRKVAIECGAPDGWVDAAIARREIGRLLRHGYTKREICRLAGLNRSTLRNITTAHHRTGEPVTRCKRETYDALCAVSGRSIRSSTLLDATEIGNRLREYRRRGLKAIDMARAMGVDRQVVDRLLRSNGRVRATGATVHAFIKAKPALDRKATNEQ